MEEALSEFVAKLSEYKTFYLPFSIYFIYIMEGLMIVF